MHYFQLVERLPLELWCEVITLAVTASEPGNSFFPPPNDMSLVNGLSKTCKHLRRIVEAFIPRKVQIRHADQLLGLSDEACGLIEMLIITNPLRPTLQVVEKAKLFTRLKRLFVVPYYSIRVGERIVTWFWTKERSHSVLLALPSLKYLDYKVPRIVELEELCFRNLIELRLGQFQGEHIDKLSPEFFPSEAFTDVKEFALFLANRLSALQLLEYLSVQVALDDYAVYSSFESKHSNEQSYLHPPKSDGSRRHYSECPRCKTNYNHNVVVQRENQAAMIIAKALSSLTRISWTNAWRNGWFDELGQRETKVVREDGHIKLIRDDGLYVECQAPS